MRHHVARMDSAGVDNAVTKAAYKISSLEVENDSLCTYSQI